MLACQKSHYIKSWFQNNFSELWQAILIDRGAEDIDEGAHKALAEILLLYPLFGEPLEVLLQDVPTAELQEIADIYLQKSVNVPQSFRMLAPSAMVLRREIISRGGVPNFSDALLQYQFSSVDYENLELSSMRFADCCFSKSWFSGSDFKIPETAVNDALRFLSQPVIVSSLNSKYVYTVTHILFYLLEFGRADFVRLESAKDRILKNLHIMAEFAVEKDDRDVLAEVVVCWHLCGGVSDEQSKRWMRYLTACENADTTLSRFGEALRTGEFFECYHTTLVYLWAVLLDEDQAPCSGLNGTKFSVEFGCANLKDTFSSLFPQVMPSSQKGTHDFAEGFEQELKASIAGDLESLNLESITRKHPLFLSTQIDVLKIVNLVAGHYAKGGRKLDQIEVFKYLDWLDRHWA